MHQISCRIPGTYAKQLKSIMDKTNFNSTSAVIRMCISVTYNHLFKYDTAKRLNDEQMKYIEKYSE